MFNPTDKAKEVGTVAMIYSLPGLGKTTLASQIAKENNGLFIPVVEDGLSPLQKEGSRFDLSGVMKIDALKEWDVSAKVAAIQAQLDASEDDAVKAKLQAKIDKLNSTSLLSFIDWFTVQGGAKDFRTIVFDSLNLIMNSLESYCMNKYFYDNPEHTGKSREDILALAYGFGKATLIDHMDTEWKNVFVDFLRKCKENNINVVITTHEQVVKVKLPQQELEYDKYAPDFPYTKKRNLATSLIKEVDIVLFGRVDQTIMKAAKKGGQNKVKGTNRILCSEPAPTYDAKCRANVPETIEFSYEALTNYIKL